MGALVLEESVDEDGRRERRVANLDSVEDARAVAEHGEAAAMERALWGSSASSGGSGKESTAEADRARGLGGGAEWPRMPGMKPIKPVSPRRSPRKRSGGGNQQKQAQTADLFGSALQGSQGVLRPKRQRESEPSPPKPQQQQRRHAAGTGNSSGRIAAQPAARRRSEESSARSSAKPKQQQQQASKQRSAQSSQSKPQRKEAEDELDDVDERKLKRVLVEQLQPHRNNLRTLTPARLRRKCAAAMAFAPESLEGPRVVTLMDQWLKEELLRDPAGYLARARA